MSASLSLHGPETGSDLIGSYRRFGEIGPVYEVIGLAGSGNVEISLVESGETAEYPVAEVRLDPEA